MEQRNSSLAPNSVQAVLCDIDGTLVANGAAIPRAVSAVTELRRLGIKLRFLTNISSKPPEMIARMLQDLGFDIEASEIETSVTACASMLLDQANSSVWLLVPDAVRHLFDRCQKSTSAPDFVVITDVREHFTYAAMNEAYLKIVGGAQIVAPHKTRFSYDDSSQRYLDAGAFIAGLEFATETDAIVTGKPSLTFFEQALNAVSTAKENTLVVGDDMSTDITGAAQCGIRSVLVETGKGSLKREPEVGGRPDWTIRTVAELPELITFINNSSRNVEDSNAR